MCPPENDKKGEEKQEKHHSILQLAYKILNYFRKTQEILIHKNDSTYDKDS